jgi:hypothetical protein
LNFALRRSVFFHDIKSGVGTDLHTGRHGPVGTKITFSGHPGAPGIGPHRALGTGKYTGPAADAFVLVMNDLTGGLILVNSTSYAGVGAIWLGTMPALQRERTGALLLHYDPGRGRYFILERLDDIL